MQSFGLWVRLQGHVSLMMLLSRVLLGLRRTNCRSDANVHGSCLSTSLPLLAGIVRSDIWPGGSGRIRRCMALWRAPREGRRAIEHNVGNPTQAEQFPNGTST